METKCESSCKLTTLPTSIKDRRHIGSKSRESPSPEGKREASVGLVGSWQHAAPGTRTSAFVNGTSGRGMGSIDSPTHTQKDCVEGDLSALNLKLPVLDVQFMELPGWSCASSYFFITSRTAEYPT
eukprot:1151981-Pelagomonas_calceolata.AAC.8